MEQAREDLAKKVIGAAIAVHKALGPGLLESAYEACLAIELDYLGLRFERQKPIPLLYRNTPVEAAYRLDFLIEKSLIVELKAVDKIDPIHLAQTLTYLRLCSLPLALLINFNVPILKDGLRRVIQTNPSRP